MTRKVLLLSTVGVTLLALLGAGIFFLTNDSRALADAGTGIEAQGTDTQTPTTTEAPATTGPSYTIDVPWPSGWVSQIDIDHSVTEYWGELTGIESAHGVVARYYHPNVFSEAIMVWEDPVWDFTDTPLSSDNAAMTEYAKTNQMGLLAWAEGQAAMIDEVIYAPVGTKAEVIMLDSGDSAYAVHVKAQIGDNYYGVDYGIPVDIVFLTIPKASNQYFTIMLYSCDWTEDEVWDMQRTVTFSQQ